jgi:hypothetical protein
MSSQRPTNGNGNGNGFAISSPSPTASTFNQDQVPHAGDASFGEDDEVSTRGNRNAQWQMVDAAVRGCERTVEACSTKEGDDGMMGDETRIKG